MTSRARPRARRDEAGAITIMVALSMVTILVAAAMVLDFGIARLDRQQNKAVADSAVTAGMHGLDRGDGKPHAFSGVCQALAFLRANKPELSSLSWAPCSDPLKLATICQYGDPSTYASFTGSANGITVEIRSPYDLATSGWSEEQLASLQADQLTAQESCDQVAVIVRQSRHPGLGSLATSSDLTTAVRSVGRVTEGTDDGQPVALLLLDRTGCDAITINGGNSYVRVLATGATSGLIHSDSNGQSCTGQQKILTGDHANGIIAYAGTGGPGLVRVRSMSSPVYAPFTYDSATNVVAQNGAVSPGPLVTRSPVDARYMSAAKAAISDYQTQAATNGNSGGWTKVACNTSKADLAAFPIGTMLWIDCKTGPTSWTTFNTANVTLNASKIFFDAQKISTDLAMPNATRVYVRGDPSTNGNAIVMNGTSFSMGQGSGNTSCPDTTTAPTITRSRLVLGAGSFSSNSSSHVRLCSTTVVLRGGVDGGCIPGTYGTAPVDTLCNGRLSMGGPTEWTAPNKVQGQATAADWSDFEDLALWGEGSGNHDVGGGGFMRLSGIFFLPNGNFQVHGGSGQNVKNSQYIARRFRADGGSVLELQPNPYDVIGVPTLTNFILVR